MDNELEELENNLAKLRRNLYILAIMMAFAVGLGSGILLGMLLMAAN